MLLSLFAIIVPLLTTLLALGLAAFVLSRNWRAWPNRWLALGLCAISLYQGLMLAAELVGSSEHPLVLLRLALAVATTISPTWLAFTVTFGESNGSSRLAGWPLALLGLTAVIPLAGLALAMGHVVKPVRLGPTGPIVVGIDGWGKVYFSLFLIGLAMVLLQLENIYRCAERFTCRKIKFLVVGVFVAFACQIVTASFALLYSVIHPLHPLLSAFGFFLGEGMIAFSLVRHRLLDVDIFVSRYVIYRSLTLVVVGGYLLFVGVVAEVFRRLDFPLDLLTGTFLAILGAVAFALLLLSEDVRWKVKTFIHAHFYKHKYDYRTEWMEFTRRLSRATAVPEIAGQTVNRILEVMWVRQVAMYTVGESPGQMTLAHQVGYDPLPMRLELNTTVVKALQEHAKLIPSAAENGLRPEVIGELSTQMFEQVPVESIIPVAALENLVGLLVVGPERSGKAFGVDDRDLLAALAVQAAAHIVNARLAQEVSEGRELKMLAQLSAFVTHDLKNAVAMLSMLAENAKLHMNKSTFQADAIRTLGEVTAKMRKLLATLSTPDSRTGAQTQSISLAPKVDAWVQEMRDQVPSRIRLETRLAWTSDVRMDPELLRSVLHNLILNSIEAISKEGTILLEAFQENGQAVLTVTDTGSGMTKEFMQHKLFRLFRTTKSRGLGIGLYQCQQIIQRVGGTLTAESQEGKGTRMIIRLPCEVACAPHSAIG